MPHVGDLVALWFRDRLDNRRVGVYLGMGFTHPLNSWPSGLFFVDGSIMPFNMVAFDLRMRVLIARIRRSLDEARRPLPHLQLHSVVHDLMHPLPSSHTLTHISGHSHARALL
jgi:hypothetical protein